jgi:hypothetical protein
MSLKVVGATYFENEVKITKDNFFKVVGLIFIGG